MSYLRRRLPPTNALVTFEAVARHLSFTDAARELGVSQAATSRQVRNLEEHLAVRLFDRGRGRTRLTPAGEQLYHAVSMAFSHIANTTDRLRRDGRGSSLTVATSVAFSTFWLMPRLGDFHARHPDLELRLVTSDHETDWFAEDVDIAVVFGGTDRLGSKSLSLFGDQVIAAGHPEYGKGRPGAMSLTDLAGEALLHTESEHPTWLSWQRWLEACGARTDRKLSGPHFNSYTITLQAALDGRGIALGWRRLIDRYLQEGRLVQVASEVLVPDGTYALVMPEASAATKAARAFRDWIVRQAEQDWT
jgi:DNA-binding transcriptional LysR family regulator